MTSILEDKKNPTFKDYEKIRGKNEELLYALLKQIQPDWYVLADIIEKNNINSYIVFKFIRQLINVSQGTGWGKITILVKDHKVTTMEAAEMDNVQEKITKLDADIFDKIKTQA